MNKLLHKLGCYSVPGGFSNASCIFVLPTPLLFLILFCSTPPLLVPWLGRQSLAMPSRHPCRLMKLRESTEGRLGALQRLASLWRLPFIYGAIAHAISITSPLSSCALPPPSLLSTHRIFSPPLHLSARDEPSEGKRTVRRGRRESGLEL